MLNQLASVPLPSEQLDTSERHVVAANDASGRSDDVWVDLDPTRTKPIQMRVKRIVDVIAAGAAILLLAPVFLLAAAAIKLSSRGPVLYRQRRLGRQAKPFVLFKFRTMVDGADKMLDNVRHLNAAAGPLFKAKNDPRITSVGRVLRRMFIDELPQLFNVVLGDMSLVGPRPCLPEEFAAARSNLSFRFAVPQGVTGPWQVGGYHALSFEQQLKLELGYVCSWSLLDDLRIVLKTIPLVLGCRGR